MKIIIYLNKIFVLNSRYEIKIKIKGHYNNNLNFSNEVSPK